VDERIEVAVEHPLDVADLDLRSMIVYQSVGVKDVRADLASEVDLLLRAGDRFAPDALLLFIMEEQTRAQDAHGVVAVAVLAALGLGLHHQAGGKVRDADRGLGLVDVLAARSAGAEGID